MGRLFRFNVPGLQQSMGLATFVETGTAKGDSLAHAAEAKFERLYSIEISPLLHEGAQKRFAADPRIQVVCADSVTGLSQVLPALGDKPALFWLDAHFPGAPIANYDAESDPTLRWPLENELEVLRRARPTHKDVILIDDLKIYIDGPFGNGVAHPIIRSQRARGLDFIVDAFKDTHNYSVMWEDEGYMMLNPRFDR
jgi:hypothetical protein